MKEVKNFIIIVLALICIGLVIYANSLNNQLTLLKESLKEESPVSDPNEHDEVETTDPSLETSEDLQAGGEDDLQQRILDAKAALGISEYKPGKPNSAGGVDVTISAINYGFRSLKEIKYLYFYVTPYNAVNDAVESEIGHKKQAVLKVTGPIRASGYATEYSWDCVWYNNTIVDIKIDKVKIEYMDDTSFTIEADALSAILP